MQLADAVEPSDPLLDFHRVPRQVEVDETMAKLEAAPFRAALRQHKNAAFAAERVGDRLALVRRSLSIDEADGRSHSCKVRGDLTLRGEKCVKITTPPSVRARRGSILSFSWKTRQSPMASLQRFAKAASGNDIIAWRQAGGLLPMD